MLFESLADQRRATYLSPFGCQVDGLEELRIKHHVDGFRLQSTAYCTLRSNPIWLINNSLAAVLSKISRTLFNLFASNR